MTVYWVVPETKGSKWKIHSWSVRKDGIFGGSKIANFVDRQQAIDYAKVVGQQNRPSQIRIFDLKGEMVFSFSYQERPRVKR